ncbi:sensor histidine kinase ResE [Peptoclostridium acidaminophilum DSM 3953]|uniref:histidine kinase n=1 Tax=Peptoclostridium acidaminophilum DSM 3953 TaxID=1286171 RepID=W8T6L3_PEPAC|nr:HAMP domain-containing sensor histidine kinase [Peptoclostridium acidaminophilum]AHM57389.1 sensor histidine kinase ResE [Peptoclostridium acidaminophilum DSM 3953]
MKKSIRVRLFLYTIGLVMSILALLFIMNSFYFEKYYIGLKKSQLSGTATEIESMLESNYSSDEIYSRFEEIEGETGIKIALFSPEMDNLYSSFTRGRMSGSPWNIVNTQIIEMLQDKDVIFGEYEHPMTGTAFLTYAKKLEGGNVALLQIPMAAVQESISANQTFHIYAAILTLLIGLVGALLFSKGFVRPILDIAEIAKRVEKLDFSKKYEGGRQDEIGHLGKSINSMSGRLEGVISSLNIANEQLKTEIEKEKRIDIMRKDFIAAVSHELKTPVALIQGYSEGLRDNIADESRKTFYCDVIEDEARRMGALVNELLELSRLESGSMKLQLLDFSMKELVNAVAAKYSLAAEERGIALDIQKTGAETSVYADREKIERAIVNYLDNAFKNVDTGGEISVRLIQSEASVRLEVENSGSRIPEKELELIWHQFYKLDKSRSRSLGGSGLGLSIVKEIVSLHNGNCGAYNTENGVVFWLEIPDVHRITNT